MDMNLDMDCLRTFVSIATLGSHAKAAERVGRSMSAISLQIDRLEKRVGQQLFRKQGRRMVLSLAGEEFLGHAQTILAANDAAVHAFSEPDFNGSVRLGAIQDFAEGPLPKLLAEFSNRHPHARVEILVERSKLLLAALEAGKLDQAIAFRHGTSRKFKTLGRRPMIWIGPKSGGLAQKRPLPIVLIDGPCAFREEALASLGEAGIPWRITLSSPSLSCLAAAVEAGLGICVRTPELLNARWPGLAQVKELPKLRDVEVCAYHTGSSLNPTAEHLREYYVDRLSLH